MKWFAKQPKLTVRTPVTVNVVHLLFTLQIFCFSSFVLRSIAKYNENTIFLLYLKSFQVCFKLLHFINQITKVFIYGNGGTAPFPIPSPTPCRGKLSDRSHTYFFSKRPLFKLIVRTVQIDFF